MIAAPLRTRLRAIDPARAGTQSALIAALNRRAAGGLALSVRAASADETRAAATWIGFAARGERAWMAPVMIDGDVARVAGPDGADAARAAAALGPLEPIIAAVEAAVGCEFHPVDLSRELPADAVLFTVEGRGPDGPPLHRLLLACPSVLRIEPLVALTPASAALANVRFAWTASLASPPLPPASLARMGPGDLILLGTGKPIACLSLPGRRDSPRARLDVQERRLVLEDDVSINTPANDSVVVADLADVRVPATIEIAGAPLTAGQIATLAPGSIVPIDAPGGLLRVSVIAGGTRVATGELVAVGDGFGVLVDAVIGHRGK